MNDKYVESMNKNNFDMQNPETHRISKFYTIPNTTVLTIPQRSYLVKYLMSRKLSESKLQPA